MSEKLLFVDVIGAMGAAAALVRGGLFTTSYTKEKDDTMLRNVRQ